MAFRPDVKAVKQFNPRFEEDFVKTRDYDVDRSRAERKRLQREVRREHRGAMRALRKDNAFMAGVRNREEARTKQATQKQYNHVFQFLQQQEQDFRSGGQKGILFNKKKK